MGVKEKNLPSAVTVTEDNLIRTVSEDGHSQNMTIDQLKAALGIPMNVYATRQDIGGGVWKFTLSATYSEIKQAMKTNPPRFFRVFGAYCDIDEDPREELIYVNMDSCGEGGMIVVDLYSVVGTAGSHGSLWEFEADTEDSLLILSEGI